MDLRATTYSIADGVGLVTLNRPDRLNAWTVRMEAEYRFVLEEADRDPAVRVIVVTGAGRGFCAGADYRALDQLAGGAEYGAVPGRDDTVTDDAGTPDLRPPTAVRPDFAHIHTWPLGLSKPVIAAVNGPAAGVGFVVMCFADIRFAAAGAKLTTSFARLGLPAEHGVSWILPRLIGAGRAADLLFSSRIVLAEEAAEMGLVSRVVAPDRLLSETLDYARRMAEECSPSSLRALKRQLWADVLGDLATAAHASVDDMLLMIREPDFAEGVAAFQARRPPRFAPPSG